MADMDAILEIAGKYNLIVIEDAAKRMARSNFSKKENCWRSAGTMGVAGAFSFYPGKTLEPAAKRRDHHRQ
jgi:dTDP-4-amino-4,6-dideoxygalactose transaminase